MIGDIEREERESAMADEALEREKYLILKDLRVEIGREEESFCLCFWLYLVKSITFPLTVIQKVHSDVAGNSPFLVVNEKKVMFFPLFSQKQARDSSDPTSWSQIPHVSLDFEFPLEKWVHFGCEDVEMGNPTSYVLEFILHYAYRTDSLSEVCNAYHVSTDLIRLHVDGEVVGEKSLTFVSEKDSALDGFGKITLVSGGGDNSNRGYIYNLEILPTISSIKYHHTEDVPVQLSMDKSSASEIEEGDGGVWSIVGGKASCRRNFSLDVVLNDACDEPVNKEMEVIASLVYLDNGAPVERTSDEEAPLLASYDGVEFASYDRPSKLLHGRASFKLRIAQLSSKCQNRLFRIMFHLPKMKTYPFLEAFSPPIRSISRSRNTRVSSSMMWRRSTFSVHPISQPSEMDEDMMEVEQNSLHETSPDSSSKRLKLGQDRVSTNFRSDPMFEQPDEECNSHASTANKVENAFMSSSTIEPENSAEDKSSSDSESTEVKISAPKSNSSIRTQISDITVFKYGLAGITERSLLLKEIANSASNEEILHFAHQVSLYSGCSHHSNQIMMAKRLVEEGTKAWNKISQNNNGVPWESIVFEIEEQFMKIACCRSRSLSQQDFELLRRISGCGEYVALENFEQMWCWLYPVANTLSRNQINTLWSSSSPRWIEGFITKEEAESSLQGPRGVQEPGTFLLRFPTSRSWPHPDAGSLVVTYVGNDYSLCHKLLSLDHLYGSAEKEKDVKPLQDMLLEEPELKRLGRIIRSHQAL